MDTPTATTLQLGRSLTLELLGDPGFYAANPAWLYLRDTARDALGGRDRLLLGNRDAAREQQAVAGILGGFVRTAVSLGQLADEDPGGAAARALSDLRAYLSGRLGYPVHRVVVYHGPGWRFGREPSRLEF